MRFSIAISILKQAIYVGYFQTHLGNQYNIYCGRIIYNSFWRRTPRIIWGSVFQERLALRCTQVTHNSNEVPCQRHSTWLAVRVCWHCWVIQTLPLGGSESGEVAEANSIGIAQALSPVMFHNEPVSSQGNQSNPLHSKWVLFSCFSVPQKHWWLLGTGSFQYTDQVDNNQLHISWTFFLTFFSFCWKVITKKVLRKEQWPKIGIGLC